MIKMMRYCCNVPIEPTAAAAAAAQDAVMYVYSAVIAAIAKPPISVKTRKTLSKSSSMSWHEANERR